MIKKLILKLLFKEKCDSITYVNYLRKLGMKIGEEVVIHTPRHVLIDTQYPWMVTIGNRVQIAQNVSIIDHDYSWAVLKHYEGSEGKGEILGSSGEIVIGNDVFIGVGVTILKGVHIGNSVIIGTGSVVSKDCIESGVYVGAPARRICSIDEFYEKRKNAQYSEAKRLAQEYYKRYGKKPKREVFHEYFMLFENDIENLLPMYIEQMKRVGNYEESKKYLVSHKPMFDNFEAFIEACELEKKW